MLRVPSEQDTMNIDKTLVDETITSLLFAWGLRCMGLRVRSRTYETRINSSSHYLYSKSFSVIEIQEKYEFHIVGP